MACGPSVRVARVTVLSQWIHLQMGGALLQEVQGNGQEEAGPCVLVTDRNPLLQSGGMGVWAGPSWATFAQLLSLGLGLEQQPLHSLVQHMEVLAEDTVH